MLGFMRTIEVSRRKQLFLAVCRRLLVQVFGTAFPHFSLLDYYSPETSPPLNFILFLLNALQSVYQHIVKSYHK